MIVIEQINCGIFRHAVWKETMEPVHPHATQEQLEEWLRTEKIFGCGKPFRLIHKAGADAIEYTPIVCEYI